MPRVRRFLVPVLIALVLTVGLSWAAALSSDLSSSSFERAPDAGELAGLRVYIPGDWTPRTWLVRRGPGLRHDLIAESIWMGSTLGASPSTAPNRVMQVVSAGWPLPALQWTTYPTPKSNGLLVNGWSRGLPITRQRTLITGDLRRLPVRPVWAGFAADVLLFSSTIAWAKGRLDRRRSAGRRARGECEGCGYHMAGLARCPECGREPAGGHSGPVAPVA